MINKDDLLSLSWTQKKQFRAAIAYGYFDDFEDDTRKWKRTFVGSFLWRYPSRCATLNRLKDIVGDKPSWEDLSDDILRDFVDETLEVMAQSSARTICAELKAVLNENRKKIPSEDFMKLLSLKNEVSQAIYLSRAEIARIINYTPITGIERYVRRNFLVEFMTGARRCDAERLTINNCDIDTGTLSYVPQKTPGIVVTVPVDERLRLREFLADTNGKRCSDDTFNDIIRRICRECGIDAVCSIRRRGELITAPKWQLVSSHTARRSFATNLYLSGVSLEDIALLMGHGKNIETTKRYICAERKLSTSVMSYFQPQDNADEPVQEIVLDD